jgi:hypothetical protein
MRNSNGVTPMTGRMSRRGLGIAVTGGAAVLVLASGGIAMASPLPGHGASGSTFARPSRAHVVTTVGTAGAGNGKVGPSPAPVQGQPGWNRISNIPGKAGAGNRKGGQGLPGSTSTPAPVTTGGQGGPGGALGGLGGGLGSQGGQGGPGGTLGGVGGEGGLGGLAPGSTPAPLPTGGLGGEA